MDILKENMCPNSFPFLALFITLMCISFVIFNYLWFHIKMKNC